MSETSQSLCLDRSILLCVHVVLQALLFRSMSLCPFGTFTKIWVNHQKASHGRCKRGSGRSEGRWRALSAREGQGRGKACVERGVRVRGALTVRSISRQCTPHPTSSANPPLCTGKPDQDKERPSSTTSSTTSSARTTTRTTHTRTFLTNTTEFSRAVFSYILAAHRTAHLL